MRPELPQRIVKWRPAGLSHLGGAELGEEAGEEGIVPSRALEFALHGAF